MMYLLLKKVFYVCLLGKFKLEDDFWIQGNNDLKGRIFSLNNEG